MDYFTLTSDFINTPKVEVERVAIFLRIWEIDCSWNMMAHGDVREEKWRGNWRMEWVASTLHTTSERGLPSSTMHTPRLPVVDWTDSSADLNRLVRFAERRNLVSARVPLHFKRSLTVSNVGQKTFYPERYCVVFSFPPDKCLSSITNQITNASL